MQEDQGEYNDKTLWEQLDGGMPWTAHKKFLISAVVVLCVTQPRARGDAAHQPVSRPSHADPGPRAASS